MTTKGMLSSNLHTPQHISKTCSNLQSKLLLLAVVTQVCPIASIFVASTCCVEQEEEYSCKNDVTRDCAVYAGCVVLIDDSFA